jgi:5-methylcytosine-specific restriction endonuclease McrA
MADDVLSLTITKKAAKAAGLTRYFTGKPCAHGHVAERLVSNGVCNDCLKARRSANYFQNIERERAKNAAYRANNVDELRAWYAAYRAADPEKLRAKTRAWDKANPDRVRTRNRNRDARKRLAEGHHTKEDVLRIYDAQKGKCACCREKVGTKYHVDHIQALTRGGSNWPSNLQILCAPCNQRKHARDPIEFMRSFGMLL